MQRTPIQAEELQVGLSIPWTIYDPSGQILLQTGAIPQSTLQIKALLDKSAVRDLIEDSTVPVNAAPASKPAPRESDKLSLQQIKLCIGDSMQLEFKSDTDNSRFFVTLIGYLENQGVIVSTPILNGGVMMVREGQALVVRLFSGKSAYAFSAIIQKVSNTPFPHLYLSYPKAVRGLVVRSSSRAPTNISCHASADGGTQYECIARDISIGGALIAADAKIGEVGDKLSLKLRVRVNSTEHVLILNCQIRSLNIANPATADISVYLHGLSFENMNSQDTLVISALLYQNLANEKDAQV